MALALTGMDIGVDWIGIKSMTLVLTGMSIGVDWIGLHCVVLCCITLKCAEMHGNALK